MPKRHEKYKNVKDNKTILFSTVLRISVRSIHLLNYKINTINTAVKNAVHTQDTKEYLCNMAIIFSDVYIAHINMYRITKFMPWAFCFKERNIFLSI